MKVVVDTNIIFSALLKANSPIADILLTSQSDLDFYAPELLKEELAIYAQKISKYTKLSATQLSIANDKIIGRINFISESLISIDSWQRAYKMTKEIDEDDTPFVALAIEFNTFLWTGDVKLIKGVNSKGGEFFLSTPQMADLLRK